MSKIFSLWTKFLFSLVTWCCSNTLSAQVEMADNFRGEGKIYVVIAIILTILGGFFYVLIKLDRKSKRLEKEAGDE